MKIDKKISKQRKRIKNLVNNQSHTNKNQNTNFNTFQANKENENGTTVTMRLDPLSYSSCILLSLAPNQIFFFNSSLSHIDILPPKN